MKTDETQNKQVLHWLVKFETITSNQAIRAYGITRLAAIIHRLKNQGHAIGKVTCFDPDNKSIHYAKYHLVKMSKTK